MMQYAIRRRRMLTVEQSLLFYGPMHLLYSVYDNADDKSSVLAMLEAHLKRWNI